MVWAVGFLGWVKVGKITTYSNSDSGGMIGEEKKCAWVHN